MMMDLHLIRSRMGFGMMLLSTVMLMVMVVLTETHFRYEIIFVHIAFPIL